MKYFDRSLSASGSLPRRVTPAALVALALSILTASAIAQDATTSTVGATAQTTAATRRPARKPFRAARLTFLEGDVRVEQTTSTANSTAVINMPLVEGTVISAGPDGQAEIEFEDGSLARLTPNSGLSLANLSVDSSGNYQTRIVLLGGLSYLELRGGTKYIYTVDAGGDVISPVENTTFRVNFDEPPASVAVLDGTAHFATAGKSFMDATAGQTVQADPSSDGSVLLVKSAIAPESWDRWNEDRDETAASEADSQTDVRSKFAGNQGYGWSDLDANGTWYDVPGHGQVWQPDIAATQDGTEVSAEQTPDQTPDQSTDQSGDFATGDSTSFDPYGYGSWAWTPVGYSWASGYGWGWLPYRCGLWSYYPGFGWGWSPNPFCGVFGFAGFGYGYGYDGGLNFGTLPPRYKRPNRPIPGPGPIHPILRGHGGGPVPVAPVHRPGGDRTIAGNHVQPLPPVGSGFTIRTGSALGAALRRDYPVDAKTHTPAIGLVPVTHGPAAGSYLRPAWQATAGGTTVQGPGQANGQSRTVYTPRQTERPQPPFGQPNQGGSRPAQGYDGGIRPAPMNRPAPVQTQHPSAPSAPRYSPPPAAPASHPAPAAPAAPSPKGK